MMKNNSMKNNSGKFLSIFAVLTGACLEYYDYMLFALMLPIISPVFFSSGSSVLTSGYFVLFLSALMRPLGGLVFGYIGDKKGRSVALFWSLMLMSFSCFAIAALPSYDQIGIFAAIFLFIIRSLQTMSAASELNGSAIFLIEILNETKQKYIGLASGLAWSFTVFGMLLASIATYYSNISNWKIPFLIGGMIGFAAMILKFVPKPPVKSEPVNVNFSLFKSSISSVFIAAGVSGMFYYNMIWMSNYLQHGSKFFGILYFSIYSVMLLLSGFLYDLVKRKHLFVISAPILLSLFAFPTLIYNNPYFHIINVVILAFYIGPSHALLFKLFPRQYRFRSISITYSVGTSIIGGITPLFCNYYVQQYPYFPAFWLIFICCIAISAVYYARNIISD